MRVRVLRAFSGNNSGSYVLVGTFREERDARALATELREVFAAHAAWLGADAAARPDASPMFGFATGQGLEVDPLVGATDDWPTYGTLPEVVTAGHQLLVFVDYSVTFPRFLGEVVYRRGGRVHVELDHSHEPVVVSHEIWMPDGWNVREEAERRIAAFRAAVEGGALASLYVDPAGKEDRGAPVLAGGFWPGAVTLVHAPWNVAEGVRAVDALVREHGLSSRLSLHETPIHGAGDPLRGYRQQECPPSAGRHNCVGSASPSTPADHQVILWKAGPDVPAVVRAVRNATGLSLSEASELVARAPAEVLLHVAAGEAKALEAALVAAGADAEALGPERFVRRT